MCRTIYVVLFFLLTTTGTGVSGQLQKINLTTLKENTGFLVLAPDRGFVGNNETSALFQKFNSLYHSSLVFVGRKYNGMSSNYSEYFQKALSKFSENGISEIVVIPLFIYNSNHILQTIKKYLPLYNFKGNIRWNSSMSESYLTAQILSDHVKKISEKTNQERLLIIGRGAIDETSEKLIKLELENLSNYIKEQNTFKSIQTGVYYSYNAEKSFVLLRTKKWITWLYMPRLKKEIHCWSHFLLVQNILI